ncbi:MAG: tetratricopeptide repeat protein [Saprospiraceae bacterium]|nr:tetratricopeptide repeat protein [Saprospiraceae bacterium]
MSQRLQRLQQMLAASPGDSFLLFAIAKEFESLGDLDQAFEHYLRLRDTDPDYVGLYYHLGKLFEKTAQLDRAIQTYRQGIAVAKKAGDRHAWSELNGARLEIDDSDDDI